MNPSLEPAEMVDSDHPEVVAFAQAHAQGADDRERAVALYYAVRDQLRYDPYRTSLTVQGMKASTALAQRAGWCVPKATALAAVCRAAGIPARLGYADVRNHLSTERMRRTMATDVFYWHGFTEILLDGVWVKATPAFNIELCDRFGLLPLEFDGRADSIYHPFDRSGQRHMEYLAQRGSFDDVPLDQLLADFHRHYPLWMAGMDEQRQADFDAEVARETSTPATIPNPNTTSQEAAP